MRAINTTSLIALLASLAVGCAAQGNDAGTGNGGGGGKADDPNERGLFVTARTTTLGPDNKVRWPVAVDTSSDVDDKINAALDFEDVTGDKLSDLTAAWSTAGNDPVLGTQNVDFEVNANMRNVLSLSVNVETLGAYSDFYSTYFNFNNNTGAKIEITDILDRAALPALATELNSRLELEVAMQKNRYSAEIASGEIPADTWDDLTVTVDDLSSFSTTEESITFHWNSGFPHANYALIPDFSTSFTIDELDSAINSDGLWADEY